MVRIGALDMLEGAPAGAALAAGRRRSCPIRFVACASARPRCWRRFRRQVSLPPTASASSAPRPNSSPPSASTPTGRRRARRSATSTPGAACTAEAEAEYKAALRLSPQYAPAAVNLADLYRQLGRDAEGEACCAPRSPHRRGTAGLHHALGLDAGAAQATDEALAELRRAAELEPGSARYAYVYAVALQFSRPRRARR